VTLFDVPGGPARVKLVVAYDGTDFRGFATQPHVRTVEGVLRHALERVLHHAPDQLTCAGRTDAGVHAWGQVVSFDTEPGLDPWQLKGALNRMLGPEVVVRECDLVAPGFDARRSAVSRHYRYTVLNRDEADPFRARYAWWVPEPLALSALRLAADPFVGEHDFAAFCRRGPEGSTTVRRVLSSRWHDDGDHVLRYEIVATAFCWQMVRAIVGTLVAAGRGTLRPGDVTSVISSRDRDRAGALAPPHGLCLMEVGY